MNVMLPRTPVMQVYGIHAIGMSQMMTILLANHNRPTIRKKIGKKKSAPNLTRNIPPLRRLFHGFEAQVNPQAQDQPTEAKDL